MKSELPSFIAPQGTVAEAHCDGPCGIYDPASARITGEAVRSMTKKLLELTPPDPTDREAVVRYHNTVSRYVSIKEEQAELTKRDLLVLWTDYFKPPH
ncbi:MAG: superoxide dismutase, Ni, partial [Myxococcota bacterium]